ncbi:dihydropteroate synthase [Numidum massiliense]|uniref:dihydropteroate synthase n=1 Tax=Numidum massiliense TaxID=1522315 RepID=UPI000AADF6F9|nr:dihydropteroate synthase [Numidum massiliense]
MEANVYVLQSIPSPLASETAFVSLAVEGFPHIARASVAQGTNIGAEWQESPRQLVLSGTVPEIRAAVTRWQETLAPWQQAVLNVLARTGNGWPHKPLKVGKWFLPWHERTLVMGILNVTPDSFSDGGRYRQEETALEHARALVAAGADMIDVGGESTRPAGVYGEGAAFVSAEEEKARVLPIVKRLARELDVPISVDTYKAEVAEAALASGAHIVNDVWGFKRDPKMATIVARYGVPAVVMHNRERIDYDERRPFMYEVIDDLRESVAIARAAGVNEDQLILDPGIGFAKTYEHNVQVMQQLEQIVALGYPVLLGTSRKSLIGEALSLPVDQRVEGTGATVSVGIAKGCRIVRVHDVQEMVRVCRMTDVLVQPLGG